MRKIEKAAALIAASAFVATSAFAQTSPAATSVATPVGVITAQKSTVPYELLTPGRATAFQTVDVRPRVEGSIQEIIVKAGQSVRTGDLLFKIEPRIYEIRVASADAAFKQAEATLQSAQDNLKRKLALKDLGISAAELQAAELSVAQAEATHINARTNLETAVINLERTEIRSPIDGVAGIPNTVVGALVTANQSGSLVNITRMNPIYIDVKESSSKISAIRDKIADGSLMQGDELKVSLIFDNGREHSTTGLFVAGDNNISRTTGTTNIRLQFSNDQSVLMPGQFLRTKMVLGTQEAILIPQGATKRAPNGDLTVFLVEDGKARQTPITDVGNYKNAWIVTGGVDEGDIIIVQGLRAVISGRPVDPIPVRVNDQGVVEDSNSQK